MHYKICLLLVIFLAQSLTAFAMPFNDDMVDNAIRAGSFARPSVAGTVPRGSAYLAPYENKESVPADLKNPIVMSKRSNLRGERLFSANCSACHSNIDQKDYVPVPAGSLMGAPNISDAFYSTRTDASFYSTIRFGNIIMPPLGWKVSDTEVWDIINYLRSVQAAKAAAAPVVPAPESKK